MTRCLVTGASGFIGRELCRQLIDAGNSVLAQVRQATSAPTGSEAIVFDFLDEVPGPEDLRGVEVVYHLAGIAHQRAALSDYDRVNVEATRQLAGAAADAGVRCFVFVSSVKAMGEADTLEARAEDSLSDVRDPYGDSKWRAEQALQAEFGRSPMAVVVLRPSLVYGEDARGNLGALSRAARYGFPLFPELGGRSMIALEDLVALMCQIGERPPRGFHTYIVSDGECYSSRRIYRALLRAAGREREPFTLPLWSWRLACSLLDLTGRMDSRDSYRRLFGTELYDASRVKQERDWQPALTLEQVLGVECGE